MEGNHCLYLSFLLLEQVVSFQVKNSSATPRCAHWAAQPTALFFSSKEIFHLKDVPRRTHVGRSLFPQAAVIILLGDMGKTRPESRIFGHLSSSKLHRPMQQSFFPSRWQKRSKSVTSPEYGEGSRWRRLSHPHDAEILHPSIGALWRKQPSMVLSQLSAYTALLTSLPLDQASMLPGWDEILICAP